MSVLGNTGELWIHTWQDFSCTMVLLCILFNEKKRWQNLSHHNLGHLGHLGRPPAQYQIHALLLFGRFAFGASLGPT